MKKFKSVYELITELKPSDPVYCIRKKSIKRQAFFNEISIGDYVVHVEHGIAKFLGTQKRNEKDTVNHIGFLPLSFCLCN